ncbi:MAG: hypothetical protein WCT08_01215 [Patescibacteria group bacterium]|jgi:hypothetical protein
MGSENLSNREITPGDIEAEKAGIYRELLHGQPDAICILSGDIKIQAYFCRSKTVRL